MAEAKEAFAKMLADAQLARKGGRPKSNPGAPGAAARPAAPPAKPAAAAAAAPAPAAAPAKKEAAVKHTPAKAAKPKAAKKAARQQRAPQSGHSRRVPKRRSPRRRRPSARAQRVRRFARSRRSGSTRPLETGRVRVHRVVIGLIAGLIVGSVIGATHSAMALRVVSWIEPVGQIWVNAIRMTIVPLVVSLLFVSIAQRDASHRLGRLGVVTIATFFGLLLFAAFVAVLLAPPLMADMKLAPEAAAALKAAASSSASGTASQVTQLPGISAWLTALVPANVIKAAADGAMLPLILFTLLFALAAREIDTSLRQALVDFFASISGAMTLIVGWIIAVAPIGVFALVVAAASRVGVALAGAMAYYILAISAVLMLFTLLMYPIVATVGGIPLPIFARGMLPPQLVALSSSSSLASLPALVESSERLALPKEISGFVLPLSVSIFKVATPITWVLGTTFLARLYGVPIGSGTVLAVAFTSVALSLTIPGVPQGAQLLLAPVLVTYGIPAEGVALLIAADTIPDLVGTMTNVTGDLVVGTVVARQGVAESVLATASSGDA
jgi:Na+/H+-dicarboxylate symporter